MGLLMWWSFHSPDKRHFCQCGLLIISILIVQLGDLCFFHWTFWSFQNQDIKHLRYETERRACKRPLWAATNSRNLSMCLGLCFTLDKVKTKISKKPGHTPWTQFYPWQKLNNMLTYLKKSCNLSTVILWTCQKLNNMFTKISTNSRHLTVSQSLFKVDWMYIQHINISMYSEIYYAIESKFKIYS